MIFELKDNTKMYCATCKKQLNKGDKLAWSSTESGTLKVHHIKCPGEVK